MEITPFVVDTIVPPKDDLLQRIQDSALSLEEHDVIAISSKVVSIWKGRCVPADQASKDDLVRQEAELYLERNEVPGRYVMHTITEGLLMPSAGIDPFGGYFVLWPENPKAVAEELLAWFKETYALEHLYVVLTDSRSVFLRRGVVGVALAWAGFEPLYDDRVRKDLLGHDSGGSQTNVPDSLAAAAVLVMGEANEQTPIVRIRNAPYVRQKQTGHKQVFNTFEFDMNEDLFAPFMNRLPWKRGKG
ncbi:MAG: coenzyme F420-0:L-glutamate ligase [Patescibacteria group bacterium]